MDSDPDNVVRLRRPFDPETMYFEAVDVIFEGESREAHRADQVYNMAVEEEKRNNPGEAERLLKHALELFKTAPIHNDVDVLKTMQKLGDLYRGTGQTGKARDILLPALKGCEEKLPPDHQLTLTVCCSLSSLYLAMGYLGEAEMLCQRAVKGFQNITHKDEPTYSAMLAAMHNLAFIYTDQDRETKAEELYIQTLKLYEQYVGPEDPAALNAFNSLGRLYLNQNKLEEAEKLFRQTARACSINMGPNNLTTLNAVSNLGLVCEMQGKLTEAREVMRRAVDGFQTNLGRGHPSTLKVRAILDRLDREKGNGTSALPSQLDGMRERPSSTGKHLLPARDSQDGQTATRGSGANAGPLAFVQTALQSIVSSVSDSFNDLCPTCRELDLQKALSYMKVVNRYPYGLLIAKAGNRFKQKPGNGCSLCEILFANRLKPLNEAEAQVEDEIRAFSFIKWFEGVTENFMLEDPGISLCVVPSTFGFGQPAERMTTHFRAHGHSFCYDRLSTRFELMFPRLVKQNFDSKLVKSWLEFCQKNHKSCRPKSQYVSGQKLIDCKTYSLVPASTDMKYVALSYVWGQASELHIDKETSTILASKLPAVISDAVRVTLALDFQYLWVDQYCIDQDDPKKHEQLNQMDLIYNNAEITIAAAAGDNQGHGLPGVHSRPRTVQREAGAGRYKIIETLADPHYSMRDSTWFTRAWTFQEGLLSRRVLVFSDDQLYYECGGMNCQEAIATNVGNLHTHDNSEFNSSMRMGLLDSNSRDISHQGIFSKVREHLEEFTSRKLSYDNDSLNAFRGVLRHFGSNDGKEVRHLWGVPYILHDGMIKYYSEHVEAYLVDAICWRHVHSCWQKDESSRPKRRVDFPSWSWAGWAGKIQHDREKHTHPMSPFGSFLFSLRLEAHDDDHGTITETLIRSSKSTHSMFTYPKALIFHALVVSPKDIEFLTPSSKDNSFDNYQWRVAGFPASLNLSRGPPSPSDFLAALHRDEYFGICIGIDNRLGLKPKVDVFVLIVDISDDGAQRCGMMTIHAPHLDSIQSLMSSCDSRMVRLV